MRSVAMAGLIIALCAYPCTGSAVVGKAAKHAGTSLKLPQRIAQHLATAVAAGLIFFSGTVPLPILEDMNSRQGGVVFAAEDGEDEDVWQKLRAKPPAHQRAVFYLVVDLFELWRVAHISYVGDDSDGKPLFVGLRHHILFGTKPVFKRALTSLVGYDGLVQENIDIEEVAYFPSRATIPYFDITLLKIHGLDMSDYEPLTVASSVAPDSDVQMLSYRVDLADDVLHFFAYPLRYRPCRAGAVVMYAKHPVLLHTCSIPYTPAVSGSPLLSDSDVPDLIAFYMGTHDEEGLDYAVPLPDALTQLLNSTLAVAAMDKMTTSWGALKQRR